MMRDEPAAAGEHVRKRCFRKEVARDLLGTAIWNALAAGLAPDEIDDICRKTLDFACSDDGEPSLEEAAGRRHRLKAVRNP